MTTTTPAWFTSLKQELRAFVEEECIPAERTFERQLEQMRDRWAEVPSILGTLKQKAKMKGLWNLFLTKEYTAMVERYCTEGESQTNWFRYGLSMKQYGELAEVMGASLLASEACNCNAPDTGNMELLSKFGSNEQKEQYLRPLLRGDIRSAFLMTEPDVASSDARNIETEILRSANSTYRINGRKWWSTGAMHPACRVLLILGKTEIETRSKHNQHSIVVVPKHSEGISVIRPLVTFGYDDAPNGHAEAQVLLENVVVHQSNILGKEGDGFQIAQNRLGPGRIHHCMRAVGLGERALKSLVTRAMNRIAFNKRLAEHGMVHRYIAESRVDLNAARAMVLHAAESIDSWGAKNAKNEIAAAKVFVPSAVLRVLDRCMQIHGGAGLSNDFWFSRAWVGMRSLRIADGPDEVHLLSIARAEIMPHVAKL